MQLLLFPIFAKSGVKKIILTVVLVHVQVLCFPFQGTAGAVEDNPDDFRFMVEGTLMEGNNFMEGDMRVDTLPSSDAIAHTISNSGGWPSKTIPIYVLVDTFGK